MAATVPSAGPAKSPAFPMSTPASSQSAAIKSAGLLAAVAALIVVLWLPAPAGLPQAGQVMLAILAFAVIVWMTEALDYSVSAVTIAALTTFLLAFAPDAAKPVAAGAVAPDMGSGAALRVCEKIRNSAFSPNRP